MKTTQETLMEMYDREEAALDLFETSGETVTEDTGILTEADKSFLKSWIMDTEDPLLEFYKGYDGGTVGGDAWKSSGPNPKEIATLSAKLKELVKGEIGRDIKMQKNTIQMMRTQMKRINDGSEKSGADTKAWKQLMINIQEREFNIQNMQKFQSNIYVGAAIAGTAAVVLASVLIYKQFFSKAAKACQGTTGDAKSICLNKYKISAYQQTIKTLEKNKGIVSSSKLDEKKKAKAVSRLDKTIGKLKQKIAKRQAKISK